MKKYEARQIFDRVMKARGAQIPLLQGQALSDFCPFKDSAGVVSWLRGVKVALGVHVEIHEHVSVIIERMMHG